MPRNTAQQTTHRLCRGGGGREILFSPPDMSRHCSPGHGLSSRSNRHITFRFLRVVGLTVYRILIIRIFSNKSTLFESGQVRGFLVPSTQYTQSTLSGLLCRIYHRCWVVCAFHPWGREYSKLHIVVISSPKFLVWLGTLANIASSFPLKNLQEGRSSLIIVQQKP